LLTERLRRAAETAALRVLSSQDRDPSSPTYGCFDRRYWAWKLVDFPEATFQRHVYPLAMLVQDPASRLHNRADVMDAIQSGLQFAVSIQHPNGSFDQAFPYEQSWGATAFLLQPMIAAFELVRPCLGGDADRIAGRLARSANFLRREREAHGQITNHLAGGAYSLYIAGQALQNREATEAADVLVARILASQSSEGWFPEYGGADPGYQTLCLYYLAEISKLRPSAALTRSLDRALGFLQWFVHPDGTLGGAYGSRRTRIAYLGGFALLGAEFPLAGSIGAALCAAQADEVAVTVETVDDGNLAPLLTNVVRALSMPSVWTESVKDASLPRHRQAARVDFAEAGLHVRATPAYYAIAGSRNGGTLTVFDRSTNACVCDDGGYVGQLSDGRLVTSQVMGDHVVKAEAGSVTVEAGFRIMSRSVPTPGLFLLLRLLNLTVMRSITIGNAIKRALVARLVAPQGRVDMTVARRFIFGERVEIHDRFSNTGNLSIRWLRGRVLFQSVHMASAGYYEGANFHRRPVAPVEIDAEALTRTGMLERHERIT
jgi:hypothetical protein